MTRRAHYEPLSHDALVAIVVELLDERDRLVAEIEKRCPYCDGKGNSPAGGKCGFCKNGVPRRVGGAG